MENKVSSGTEGLVVCQNSSGAEIHGTILRFSRFQAVFELYVPSSVLRMSEVLKDFKIILNNRTVYSGRAVVSNLMNTGEVLVADVTLEDNWVQLGSLVRNGEDHLRSGFNEFLQQWQKSYRIQSDFKVAVSDMRSLLSDMRLWLGQIELEVRSAPSGNRETLERDTAQELSEPVLNAIDSLGDRFEDIASRLEPDLRPAHIYFTRLNLHSLLLSSPFSYRTYHKPLGYAGDYEMVNMMLRSPYEGASLFSKIINAWFLNQLPAQAHRNRIDFLKNKLMEEVLRVMRTHHRPARIFNLGCGPATEIRQFLSDVEVSDHARFTLLDFNEETIRHTSSGLQDLIKRHSRQTVIEMQKKSVQQVLKEAVKPGANAALEGKFDFLYCAGLFDYLPDRVCKQLMTVFYQWLTPGGSMLVTNVDSTRPFRNKLEFILDWNLIYRTGPQLAALKPDDALAENGVVTSDWTSVNVFYEVKKPLNV